MRFFLKQSMLQREIIVVHFQDIDFGILAFLNVRGYGMHV